MMIDNQDQCTAVAIEVVDRSHMSGALDGTEKNSNQKLDHPMLVQPILSQKNQKSKFFNEPFFCN